MTLRERIANWISGGSMSATDRMLQHYITIASQQRDKIVSAEHEMILINKRLTVTEVAMVDKDERIAALESALTLIADQKTEKANATVKRMARIAYEARAGRMAPTSCSQRELSFEETHGRKKGMAA